MKTLGVVGGLGPMATAYFYELVTAMTDAETDQQHIDMTIYSIPSTPDRTAFLLGKSDKSPLPPVLKAVKRLDEQGVACIAIPCVTMSCFVSELREAVATPVIDMVEETAVYLKQAGVSAAGIMATDGTILFERFQKALTAVGIRPVAPDKERQRDVMHIIYDNVKMNKPVEMDRFNAVASALREDGAQCVILGCTELSVVKRDNIIGAGFIDAMEILSLRCVQLCGAPLDLRYRNLITEAV